MGNIIRIIGGQSTWVAKDNIDIIATEGDVVFSAAEKVIMVGEEEGITYGDYIDPPASISVIEIKSSTTDIFPNNDCTFIATKYSREPSGAELASVKWGYSINDGDIIAFKNPGTTYDFNTLDIKGKKAIKTVSITKDLAGKKLTVYAYLSKIDINVKANLNIIDLVILITDQVIGYTIQRIFYLAEDKSPGNIVPVYKAIFGEMENGTITKQILSFGVTRDGWQNIGTISYGKGNIKYYLLNRTFEPKNPANNIFIVRNQQFPYKYKGIVSYDAFLLTQGGKAELEAEPLDRTTNLNGTSIHENRKNNNYASNVFLHISGHYSSYGYDRLGGSLGCFGFVESADIMSSELTALNAHKKGLYQQTMSNKEWNKVATKVEEIQRKYITNVDLKIQVIKRTNYPLYKTIDIKDILWED